MTIILLVLLLSVAGCTGHKPQNSVANDATEQAQIQIPKSEETQPAASEEPEPTDTEPVPVSDSAQETVLERGIVDGNSYHNASLGFGCTLSEGWSFYDDTQIGQGSGEKTTPFDELFRTNNTAYDMLAMKADDNSNVSVSVQKLGGGAQMIDEEAFADLSIEGTKSMMTAYGMTVTECDKQQITFLGEAHWSMYVVAEYAGTRTVQRFVFLKYGDCFAMVSAAAFDLQTVDALLQSAFWRD